MFQCLHLPFLSCFHCTTVLSPIPPLAISRDITSMTFIMMEILSHSVAGFPTALFDAGKWVSHIVLRYNMPSLYDGHGSWSAKASGFPTLY